MGVILSCSRCHVSDSTFYPLANMKLLMEGTNDKSSVSPRRLMLHHAYRFSYRDGIPSPAAEMLESSVVRKFCISWLSLWRSDAPDTVPGDMLSPGCIHTGTDTIEWWMMKVRSFRLNRWEMQTTPWEHEMVSIFMHDNKRLAFSGDKKRWNHTYVWKMYLPYRERHFVKRLWERKENVFHGIQFDQKGYYEYWGRDCVKVYVDKKKLWVTRIFDLLENVNWMESRMPPDTRG